MAARSPAWVCSMPRVYISIAISNACISVDLGGSLAVASRGLFATGVSTDLNGESTGSVSLYL